MNNKKNPKKINTYFTGVSIPSWMAITREGVQEVITLCNRLGIGLKNIHQHL